MQRRTLTSLAIGCGFLAALACSSNSEDADGADDMNTGDDLSFSTGGRASGSGGGPTSGGGGATNGSIALTPAQVDSIREQECTGTSTEAEQFPAVLELVVDVSASMRDPAPGGGGTKWDVTQRALIQALEKIPASVAVGLQLFPTSDARNGRSNPGCVDASGNVPIEPLGPFGSSQRALLEDLLRRATLRLGTPTHDAFEFALEQGLGTYQGIGQRFMLVITDGAPTQLQGCGVLNGAESVATDPIVESIAEAAALGVRTFIIGSPGSEVSPSGDMRPWLSEAAFEGGTPLVGCSLNGPDFCHLDMTEAPDFSAALTQGLGSITAQVGNGCTFDVPSDEDINRAATSLIIEWGFGQADLILNTGNEPCSGDGWSWNSSGQVQLCDATCSRVNLTAGARVSVSFDCDIQGIEEIFK